MHWGALTVDGMASNEHYSIYISTCMSFPISLYIVSTCYKHDIDDLNPALVTIISMILVTLIPHW